MERVRRYVLARCLAAVSLPRARPGRLHAYFAPAQKEPAPCSSRFMLRTLARRRLRPHRLLSSGADGLLNHHTPAIYSRRTAAARCTCAGVRTRQSCYSAAAAASA